MQFHEHLVVVVGRLHDIDAFRRVPELRQLCVDAIDVRQDERGVLRPLATALAFIARKVEERVAFDGTTEHAAELVLPKVVAPAAGRQNQSRVEHIVAYELERAAVTRVLARLGEHVDQATHGPSGFGGEAVVHDAKLLDRLLRDSRACRAVEGVVVVEAVDRDIVQLPAKSCERDAGLDQRCVQIRASARHIRGQERKVEEVPAVHRQRRDVQRRHRLALRRLGGFNQRRAGGRGEQCSMPGSVSVTSMGRRLTDAQLDAGALERPETPGSPLAA